MDDRAGPGPRRLLARRPRGLGRLLRARRLRRRLRGRSIPESRGLPGLRRLPGLQPLRRPGGLLPVLQPVCGRVPLRLRRLERLRLACGLRLRAVLCPLRQPLCLFRLRRLRLDGSSGSAAAGRSVRLPDLRAALVMRSGSAPGTRVARREQSFAFFPDGPSPPPQSPLPHSPSKPKPPYVGPMSPEPLEMKPYGVGKSEFQCRCLTRSQRRRRGVRRRRWLRVKRGRRVGALHGSGKNILALLRRRPYHWAFLFTTARGPAEAGNWPAGQVTRAPCIPLP